MSDTADTASDRTSRTVIGAGKVAVITGAASGMGRSMAERFAAEGSAIVVADLEHEAAERVASGIRAAGGEAHAVAVDVSDPASVDALATSTLDRFGRVDLLCNNAGVSTFNLIRDQTLEDWHWVFNVNLWGVVHGIHTFVPIMREQGTRGHIVNTSSIAGILSGIAFIGPYAATKVAVVSISETLNQELQIDGTNIGVSVLCPSSVNTRVMESERNRPAQLGAEARTELAESVRVMIKDSFTGPSGKTPEEVADIVLDAVRNDRFWILTHPESDQPGIRPRYEQMLASFPAS